MTTITVIGKKVPEIKAVNVQLYKDPDEPIQPPVESKYIERKTAEERRKQAEAKERHTNKLNKAEADRRKMLLGLLNGSQVKTMEMMMATRVKIITKI